MKLHSLDELAEILWDEYSLHRPEEPTWDRLKTRPGREADVRAWLRMAERAKLEYQIDAFWDDD
jgi:hypothetical protein